MQTRRDQVQAHAFVSGRLVSAMLNTEPDERFSPLRRFSIGTIVGVLIGIVVVAGFGIYGFFAPAGATSWRKPGALIVEKETGARYVYVDGALRPVLNYTSAALILEGKPNVVRVSRGSLKSVPRGLPVGIPSAPDSLPNLVRKNGGNWQVCSSLRQDASAAPRPWVTVWVGGKQPGRPLREQEAMVVLTPNGQRYLVWNNRRLLVPSAAVLSALGFAAVRQHLVGWAFINSVPAGPDLVAPDIPDRGKPGPQVDGRPTVVGQLFRVVGSVADGANNEFYVVRSTGLAPLTSTASALVLADPNTAKAYQGARVEVLPLGPAAMADAPRSPDVMINQQHPERPPKAAEVATGEVPCVRLTMNASTGPTAELGLRAVPAATNSVPPAAGTGDRLLADRVVVEPGAGLLMRNQPAPGVTDGALYLLVDVGVRFPLPSDEVAKILGYAETQPVPVPAALLAVLPVGPSLDPAAARATDTVSNPAPGNGRAGPPGQGNG